MNLACLSERARVLREIRAFFDARGFTEVETPVRIPAPAPEPHIDCPPSDDWFLRASPELQMKKLLAAGMERIYQIGPCFRAGEKGSRHSPEFTMLEWYRANADYMAIMSDMEALIRGLWRTFLSRDVAEFRRVTVRDAYAEWAGWDPFERFDQDRFDFDMATKIEPNLPHGAVFLMDYPVEAASLSKVRRTPGGVPVAERWELYTDGMELANAFSELCDPDEQAARFREAAEERQALGEAGYPLDAEFLGSLGMIGSAAGAALGFDRIVMLLTGEKNISSARVV